MNTRSLHINEDDEPQVDHRGRYFWRLGWNAYHYALDAPPPPPREPVAEWRPIEEAGDISKGRIVLGFGCASGIHRSIFTMTKSHVSDGWELMGYNSHPCEPTHFMDIPIPDYTDIPCRHDEGGYP